MVFINGQLDSESKPLDGSRDAYELAFELRPDYKDSYILVDGEYVDKDEE